MRAKLILAAVSMVSLAGLAYAADPPGGGMSGSGSPTADPGPGISAPLPPGTTPGSPPGSDLGRTPGPGSGADSGIGSQPDTGAPPGKKQRQGESSLGIERQPLPPGSSAPSDSGLPPPPKAGEGQGTGSGLGSPTPGLGGNAPSNPAGSMGSDAPGSGSPGSSTPK